MAATTPYQPNDYQAVSNYRPYQLPINDIFKAISAQNQFWEEGARRVKSVYDNALNLKLSLEPNRVIRERFMQEAEKQLTKLSTMDVSDPSVQRQGFDIFKPLFQDVGVMSDDQATRWIEDVQGDIQRARETDNGKAYADSNAMVAMEGVYEFKNAKDRFAGQGYLQNKRSYSPYYDPSKEMMEITKNCKGPTFSNTFPGAEGDMYLHTKEASGASPARLKGCLQAALSPKAKDQIGIDGYAAYMTQNRIDHPEGKNYQALRDDYVAHNKGALDSITQEIGDLDGSIVAFQAKYDKTKDVRYLDMKKSAEEARGQYLDQAKNLQDAFNQVASGNLDYIKKNYGTLAEQIYTNKQLSAFSSSFNNENDIEKYSVDASRLQLQRLVYDEQKQKAQFQHDKEMEEQRTTNDLKIEAAKLGKKGLPEDLVPVSPALRTGDEYSQGYNDFNKERVTALGNIDKINEELFNTLKRKYPQEMGGYTDPKTFFTPGPNGISPALSFLDKNGRINDDQDVANWKSQSGYLTTHLGLLDLYDKVNNAEVVKRVPTINDLSTIKERFTAGGYDLSAQDVKDVMDDKHPIVGMRTEPSYSPYSGARSDLKIFYDKRTGEVIAEQKDGKNWQSMMPILRQLGEKTKDLTNVRNEVYGRTMLMVRPDVYAAVNNADKDDPTRTNIRAAVGAEKVDDVQIISKNPITGEADVRITGTKANPIPNNFAKTQLSNITFVDELPKYDENKNSAVIRIRSPYLIDARAASNPLATHQKYMEMIAQSVNSPTSPYQSKGPGQILESMDISPAGYDGRHYRIEMIKTSGGIKYDLYMEQPKNVVSADGTITQEKGKYYSTGQSFTSSNEVLGYINANKK